MAETVETAIYRLRVEGQEQIDRLTKSIDNYTVAEEDATKATRTTSDELQKRIARYDPLIRAQRAYAEELERIARYQETGKGTQQELNALFEGATARYQYAQKATQQLGEAHKGLDGAGQAALHSMRSFFEQIALGVSPVQAITGQLSHLSYVAGTEGGITGAFKQAGSVISGLLSPINLVIGAIVALIATVGLLASRWAEARKEMERGLIGAGRDTSISDLQRFQTANASLGGLSISEARAGGIGLAKTGQIDINQLRGYEQAVRGFSILTGKDIPEAMAAMQKALTSGASGVDELNKTYMAFDATARKNIGTMAQAADQTKAAQAMIDALAESNKQATATVSAAEEQWAALKNFFANLGQSLGQTREELIATKQAQLEWLESIKASFLGGLLFDAANQIEKLRKELAALAPAANDASAAMKQLSIDADNVVRSLIPQLGQLEKAQAQLTTLKEAKASGLGGKYIDTAIEKAEVAARSLNSEMKKMETSSAAGRTNWDATGTVIDEAADATERQAKQTEEAARAAEQQAQAMRQAAQAAEDAAVAESMVATKAALAAQFAREQRSLFEPVIMPTGTLEFTADPRAQVSYRGGGAGRRLDVGFGAAGNIALATGLAEVDPTTGQLMPTNPLEKLPDKTTDLTQSIDDLKTSTDSLNATNQELLSPYYTQDPRTSHIGFRSQGMATGGWVDVPGGYSANDNMFATIPVASGERIYIDPMNNRRGTSAGSGMVINISSPVTINGNANKEEFGRTLYQANQMLAKQVRAATQ